METPTVAAVKVHLLRLRFSLANKVAINSYLFAVMSTYKDPFPGWTDNLYGPSGLCTWSARGLVRCIYGTASCKANMVPADYVVNAMIATAWDIARRLVHKHKHTAHRYSTQIQHTDTAHKHPAEAVPQDV